MVKRVISVILQALLLWIVFAVGSFLPGFNMMPMWRVAAGTAHWFVLNGVILMLAMYLVILGIEAARRRFATSAWLTTLALVLAFVLGMAMKFPFMDRTPGI